MYNLLIKYAPDAWEGEEGDMDVERFYGGRLEPEGTVVGTLVAESLTRPNLDRLIGLPTLLMYEAGTPGSHAGLVRYGRVTSVERYGKVLSFTFEPDPEHGYLLRTDVMRFAKHLEIERADSHTHWALRAGNIPPRLVQLGKPSPPIESPAVLQEEFELAREAGDDQLARALRLRLERLEPHTSRSAVVAPKAPRSTDLPPIRRVVAVVVGIEQYNELGGSGLDPVEFAQADARGFVDWLRGQYGKLLDEPTVLLDANATLNTIRDELAYRIAGLEDEDLFVFYYAGHGFHGSDGNRLTAADSHAYRLENTTLSLEEVLVGPLRAHGARRALAFIDACAESLPRQGRDVIANLEPDELSAFLNAADFSAVFLSCKPGEKSYPSPLLKHGIWTFHLLQALRGEAPEAARNGVISDASLKDYLAQAVPRFIREKTQIKGRQTPQAAIRSAHAFEISRLKEQAAMAPQSLAGLGLVFTGQVLEGRSGATLKSHPAWRSGFRAPTHNNLTTRGFVENLVTADVSNELQELYLKTKGVFGLARREISKEEDGARGSLDTDLFRFTIEGGLDPDDLTRYRILRRLELRDSSQETLAKLDEVFEAIFQELVGDLDTTSAKFDDVVDIVEQLEVSGGGHHSEDERTQTATYQGPDGGQLVISLSARRVAFSKGGRATASGLLQETLSFARQIGAQSSPSALADVTNDERREE